jgi:arylsulfatase A-like enzyme
MIHRREFVQSLGASLAAPAPRTRKPNLLFVFSDEHRACSMPGEPYNEAQAPNLARLAREGISFRNCVSNYPVCSPYRAMLMTGRWPYQTGIIDNALQLRDEETSLGETFARHGYRTGYIGKWHLSPGDEGGKFIPNGPGRQGFEEWHVWSGTNQHFDKSFTFSPDTGERIQPKGYNCTRMTDTALEFIRDYRARPWMLMLSWNPPHPVYDDAPEEFMKRYDPASLVLRPNVMGGAGPKALRRSLQGYYAHITALDAEMGRLLKRLDETGQADNTIVVYTSDHGDMMGSHGFGGKRLPYEESCRTPFLVRYPGTAPAGRTSDVLLSAIDIYPSLCGLAV